MLIRNKFNGFSATGQRTLHFSTGGGGGGSQQPSQQTVTNTSIPEYARPYVEDMLGKASALTDINQNPYQTYGGQRIQDFTPLQQQAFGNIANMKTAGELNDAAGLAGIAGIGSMGAGANYQRMATDPNAISAYMNPYLQQSLAPQLQQLQRQGDLQSQQAASQATAAGAFGGTRGALARNLAQQNSLMAQQNAIGQGYNTAFQNAQQAQQFGANLGLQGYGQGLQAANTLGQLGQTRFGQQQAINQAQQQAGAVQQAQGQQGLDLAYQNFLAQKNYPYQQLGFMSDMVRGLPLSQASQQIYSAPPNFASQLGGLGMSALGIYGMSGGFKGAKEGGLMKYKEGGQIGYNFGGDIKLMNTEQLQKLLESPSLSPIEQQMVEETLMERKRIESNPEAAKMLGRSGVGAISTGNMVPEEAVMAKEGGIMHFANRGAVKPEGYDERRQKLEDLRDKIGESLIDNKSWQESDKAIQELNKNITSQEESLPYRALTSAGFAMAKGNPDPALRGNFLSNLGTAGEAGLGEYGRGIAQIQADKKLGLQQQVEAEKAKFARNAQLYGQLSGTLGQMDTKELMAAQNAVGRDANALAKNRQLLEQAQGRYNNLFTSALDKLTKSAKPGGINYKKYKTNPDLINQDARKIALDQMAPELKSVLNFDEAIVPGVDKPVVPGVDKPVVPGVDKPVAPAAPAAAAPVAKTGAFLVTTPDGKQYTFPTQEAADKFKKAAGLS